MKIHEKFPCSISSRGSSSSSEEAKRHCYRGNGNMGRSMAFMFDGSLEIDAHLRSDLDYQIFCLDLEQSNLFFSFRPVPILHLRNVLLDINYYKYHG